jgi:hypothetical protein
VIGRSSGSAPGSPGRSSGVAPGSAGPSSGVAPGSSGRLGGLVTQRLARASPAAFGAVAIFAAFGTYFCRDAYRKAFVAAGFATPVDLGPLGSVDLKILYVNAQILGYALSKFAGIKVVSETGSTSRGRTLIGLIVAAELALLGFALLPAPWGAFCLFLNGLPLGMVWGLVFSFLEGRRTTEVLGAGLSASYIVASGAVKTIGAMVLALGVPEHWMPVLVGLGFLPLLLGFVWLLTRLPPPTVEDVVARTRREPMDAAARRAFFRAFAPGLTALTGLYFLLTAYRSIRDDFAPEIWRDLGLGGSPAIMTWSELPVALGVLLGLAALMIIRDNRKALLAVHAMMAAGTALIGLLTLAFDAGLIGPEVWMIGVGLGLYLAYVPFGSMLFDRLIAASGHVATAAFMIYVTDAVGYVGSVALSLLKSLGARDLSWLAFFRTTSYATAIICTACFAFAGVYFARRTTPSAARA